MRDRKIKSIIGFGILSQLSAHADGETEVKPEALKDCKAVVKLKMVEEFDYKSTLDKTKHCRCKIWESCFKCR
tara:strand:- start:201 stop:419 length:219 start_codon:yes stop_codon:yes gene_type:complete